MDCLQTCTCATPVFPVAANRRDEMRETVETPHLRALGDHPSNGRRG